MRPQRTIAFNRLAGSTLGPRTIGKQSAPQKPKHAGKSVNATTQAKPNTQALGDWLSLKIQKVHYRISKFEDLQSFKFSGPPHCEHGVQLTQAEAIFEWPYKRKFFFPVSFECYRCNPTCVHGCPLDGTKDNNHLAGRERISTQCPECNPKITSSTLIQNHLYRKGLSADAAKGLIEGCLITSFGQVITKGCAYFVQGGGSRQVETIDAQAQGYLPTNEIGCGPDHEQDDNLGGWGADEDGDPVEIGPSDVREKFDQPTDESGLTEEGAPHAEVQSRGNQSILLCSKSHHQQITRGLKSYQSVRCTLCGQSVYRA